MTISSCTNRISTRPVVQRFQLDTGVLAKVSDIQVYKGLVDDM